MCVYFVSWNEHTYIALYNHVLLNTLVKFTFTSMNIILAARNISIAVRLRVLKCNIWSTLLYGCETWTISGDMIKRLEALETWFYRRMLRISWKEKVTIVEVYRRMNTSTSLLIDFVHRQLTFLGHILRKGELENLVVTGFVDGSRDRGRQRETFLTYLSKIVGKSPLNLINLAKKRDVWTKFCAHSNIRLLIWYTMMMMIVKLCSYGVHLNSFHSYNQCYTIHILNTRTYITLFLLIFWPHIQLLDGILHIALRYGSYGEECVSVI